MPIDSLQSEHLSAIACLAKGGYRGSLWVVSEWATRRRRAEMSREQLGAWPPARTIARLMTIGGDLLTKSEIVTIAAGFRMYPRFSKARIEGAMTDTRVILISGSRQARS
ncbi:MAG TPA: hypothetical protein DIT93_07080 [Pelagibacterium sp.]|nr:hypothetical protein [Pelagibacterium sp.]